MISLLLMIYNRNRVTNVISKNYIIPMIPYCPSNSNNFLKMIVGQLVMLRLIFSDMLQSINIRFIRIRIVNIYARPNGFSQIKNFK